MPKTRHRKDSFVHRHSLSIASASILVVWICLYSVSSPFVQVFGRKYHDHDAGPVGDCIAKE